MNNQSMQSALRNFERVEQNYVEALREKGLAFADAHARDEAIGGSGPVRNRKKDPLH